MLTTGMLEARDFLHAQLCYQLFITPIHLPLEKEYRHFANRACEYFASKRSEVFHQHLPRHHIIHHFAPLNNPNAKKILIAHGWISRAAYMIRIIRALQLQGYDVYAPDFPAHGEAKGLRLPWTDAVFILKNIINDYGPFYAVIGHSFGGSMLLNTINLAGQIKECQLSHLPQKTVLIASPTRMNTPLHQVARRFKLNEAGYRQFYNVIYQQAAINPRHIRLSSFLAQKPHTPFLCIHGEEDNTVSPLESIIFCHNYPHAKLQLLPKANHVSVLIDERVENIISEFLM